MQLTTYAIKSLLNRKKMFYSLLLTIVLTITILIIVLAGTLTTLEKTLEAAYNQYGEHAFIINQTNENEYENISSQYTSDKIGTLTLLNAPTYLEEQELTLGSFDHVSFKMGHLSLQEGRMPENDNEIIIESYLSENMSLSDVISLNINNVQYDFKIVGIVNNYSYLYTAPNTIQKGVNNYPNIIVHKQFLKQFGDQNLNNTVFFSPLNSYYIGFQRSLKKTFIQLESQNLQIIYNDNLIHYLSDNYMPVQNICALFTVILLIGALICILQMFNMLYKRSIQRIAQLLSFGATKRKLYNFFGIQIIFIFVISFICSLSIIFLINGATNHQIVQWIKYAAMNTNFIVYLTCWGTLLLFLILLFINRIITKGLSASIADQLKQKKPYTHSQHTRWFRLPSINIIIVLCFCFLLSFFSLVFANETHAPLDERVPDYLLYAKNGETAEIINGWFINTDHDSYFDFSLVKKLKAMPEVKKLVLYPNTRGMTLLLKKDDISYYFKQWKEKYDFEDTEVENSMVKKYRNLIPKEFIPVPLVEFIIVDQKQYDHIAKNYNLSPKTQQTNALPYCLVFLPNSQNSDGIESRDKINIGRLKLSNNALEFENFDLWVEGVSRQIYQDQELLGSSQKEIISIVIPENVVEQHGLFNGFSNIQAYLNGDVTPKINQAMHNISSHVTGGFIQSKQEFNQQSQTLSLYIAQIASTMFLVIAVYVVICITSIIYIIILERQDEYALKLSLGMSRFNLLKSFFTELIICNSLAFVISVTCILWYMYGAVFSISLWNYIGLYLVIYFVVSILLSLTLYVPLRYLKKNSIASMFNISE